MNRKRPKERNVKRGWDSTGARASEHVCGGLCGPECEKAIAEEAARVVAALTCLQHCAHWRDDGAPCCRCGYNGDGRNDPGTKCEPRKWAFGKDPAERPGTWDRIRFADVSPLADPRHGFKTREG